MLAQTGLGNVERQPLLFHFLLFFFFLEVYLCENSRAAQSEDMSGLLAIQLRVKGQL